jgi:hypothetical protein
MLEYIKTYYTNFIETYKPSQNEYPYYFKQKIEYILDCIKTYSSIPIPNDKTVDKLYPKIKTTESIEIFFHYADIFYSIKNDCKDKFTTNYHITDNFEDFILFKYTYIKKLKHHKDLEGLFKEFYPKIERTIFYDYTNTLDYLKQQKNFEEKSKLFFYEYIDNTFKLWKDKTIEHVYSILQDRQSSHSILNFIEKGIITFFFADDYKNVKDIVRMTSNEMIKYTRYLYPYLIILDNL